MPFEMDRDAGKQLNQGTILADRYLIQDVIGVGGMSSVYRARDMHFPKAVKWVAIKEMINEAPDPLVRKTIVQNFEREANLLVSLSHTAIPKIYDYFTRDACSYLVLEYIQGKDLERIINSYSNFLPVNQVITWAIELCDVLDFLHNHKPEPIVFRDMKPSNVMINMQNHVILIDFGIAKNFSTGQKGTMIGTEGYSPPEQYRGEATAAADIYALGATLHHILTRRDPRLEPPFTFSERPIQKTNASVPSELEDVITKCLQYNPEDRFKTTSEIKEVLLKIAQPQDVRHSSLPVQINKNQAGKMVWKFDSEDEIRGTPCVQDQVVYFGSYDHYLYALNVKDGTVLWKYKTEGGIVGQPVVNDGVVYFGSEDHRLFALSTRTGKLLWTFETGGPIRCSPKVIEGQVCVGSDDGQMHMINTATSRQTFKVDASGAIRSTPSLAEGYIYFGCESGEVYSADFHGQIRWRFKAKRAVTSSPLVDQGVVYFSSTDALVYALDARTGWAAWRFRLGKGSVSSPTKAGNLIFVGSADGYIYAIDKVAAKEVWKFQTEHQVSGSPVIYEDSIYCGSADGRLYCLDWNKGSLKWKFETQGPITGMPVVSGSLVFFGSHDHTLYAINIKEK